VEKRLRAVYKGKGFVTGVPARDLTADEVERFGLATLRRGRLWAFVEEDEPGGSGHDGDRGEVEEEDSDG